MTSTTAAIRYARALFDVARTERVDLASVEQQLAGFVDLFRKHDALGRVLLNAAIPAPRKRAAVSQIAEQLQLLPVVSKVVVLLAERDRLVLLPDLLAAFRDRLLDYQNVVRAEVTTAVPLDGGRTAAIERSLAQATGRNVALTTRVDPALVGGLVARIGSTVYDASIVTQLQKLKQRLADTA
jgi:F-type H+-transporting ATPase subunit delta